MAIAFNGNWVNAANNIHFNGQPCKNVYYNGNLVWQHAIDLMKYAKTARSSEGGGWDFGAWVPCTYDSRGASGVVYCTADFTPWKILSIGFTINEISTYGGIKLGWADDFSSMDLKGLGPAANFNGWDMSTNNGYTTKAYQLDIDISGVSGNHEVGAACIARSSVQANSKVTITSALLLP